MKTTLLHSLIAATLFTVVPAALAQLPVISSFDRNGLLLCTNLQPGTIASVEWASSLSGPWQTNWAGLDVVAVASNGTISVGVPMFYRVRGFPPATTADGMALVPAGSFTIGNVIINGGSTTNDPDITDANPTNVYVSAFYMDTNLVSYSQWTAVYTFAVAHGYAFIDAGAGKGPNHPVYNVDWFDCVAWCNARSMQAGLTPCYYTDAGFTQPYTNATHAPVYLNLSNKGYRLPTEAEWEKAARGGLTGQRFPLGNTISESQANYYGNTSYGYDLGPNGYNPVGSIGGITPATSPVGSFAPNGYGLYDLAGNLQEWCWDLYAAPPYPTGSPYLGGTDPTGPASAGLPVRVLRGGDWNYNVTQLRCANRYDGIPYDAYSYFGFRSVRGL